MCAFLKGVCIYITFRPQQPEPEQLNCTRSFSRGSGSDLIQHPTLGMCLWIIVTVCVCVWLNTYGGVFRAGCYDVFKEGIPLDVQHVSLMAAHLWVVGVQSARLEQRHKPINIYGSASEKSKTMHRWLNQSKTITDFSTRAPGEAALLLQYPSEAREGRCFTTSEAAAS